MSVAERGGDCAVRHERAIAAKAARRNSRFIGITVYLLETEPGSKAQDKLPPYRVFVPGDVRPLVHAQEALLHERDLHVGRERVAKTITDAAREIRVQLKWGESLSRNARAKTGVAGCAERQIDDLVESDRAAPGVKGRKQLRDRRIRVARRNTRQREPGLRALHIGQRHARERPANAERRLVLNWDLERDAILHRV